MSLKCHNTKTNVFEQVRNFFEKAVPGWIDAHVVPILHFVEALKTIEEGAAVVIEAVFPKVPPQIFSQIDAALGDICSALQIEIDCAGANATIEQRIACIARHLSTLHPEMRHAIEVKLASWLTRITAGQTQFTADQIDSVVQFTYSQTKHAATPPPPAEPQAQEPQSEPAPVHTLSAMVNGNWKMLNTVSPDVALSDAVSERFQQYGHLPEFAPGLHTFKISDAAGTLIEEKEIQV